MPYCSKTIALIILAKGKFGNTVSGSPTDEDQFLSRYHKSSVCTCMFTAYIIFLETT